MPALGKKKKKVTFSYGSHFSNELICHFIFNYKKIMAEVCLGQPCWKLCSSNHIYLWIYIYTSMNHHSDMLRSVSLNGTISRWASPILPLLSCLFQLLSITHSVISDMALKILLAYSWTSVIYLISNWKISLQRFSEKEL